MAGRFGSPGVGGLVAVGVPGRVLELKVVRVVLVSGAEPGTHW